MKQFVLIIFLQLFFYAAQSQTNTCIVLLDSIKGTYEGACEKGKANGMGKARGADSYEGNFKNGLPDGTGKYVWKNGNYYDGNWKKGLKEGSGEMHYRAGTKDSVVTGFWKKDEYKGLYEKPYHIYNVTTEIGRVGVSKMGKGADVSITVEGLMSGNGFKTSVVMTSFQITRGQFLSKSTNTLTNKDITVFRGVMFPFRGTFNFGNSIFEIEIFEEGSWDIMVPINK